MLVLKKLNWKSFLWLTFKDKFEYFSSYEKEKRKIRPALGKASRFEIFVFVVANSLEEGL